MKLNTAEIPYLQAPINYSLIVLKLIQDEHSILTGFSDLIA